MESTTGYICTTCGVLYAKSRRTPPECAICNDERQFVNPAGQDWTTIKLMQRKHRNEITSVAPSIYAIRTEPEFAISQTAYLITTPGGNILWDCVSYLDNKTIKEVEKLGGVQVIAISHPHFYASMSLWSKAFKDIPVYIHRKDEAWVFDNFQKIIFWDSSELLLWDDIRLIHCGGHFAGSAALLYPASGALFSSDTIQVCADKKSISCMYSYPNLIPLSLNEVLRIKGALAKAEFEKIYGGFGKTISAGAKTAVNVSLERYLTIFK